MPDQLFALLLPQARVFTKWLIVVLHKMVTVNYPTGVILRGQFSLGGSHLGWNLRKMDQKTALAIAQIHQQRVNYHS